MLFWRFLFYKVIKERIWKEFTVCYGLENPIDVNGLLGVGSESIQGDEDASANAYGYNGYKNNGNFDLDCINNNDNEGGQEGITGPQGPQGPPGPNQIVPTSIYTVFGNLSTTEATGGALSFALCDSGDTVLSGSFFLSNPGISNYNILDKATTPQNGWFAQAVETDPSFILGIQAIAQCFDNPPLRP